MKNNCIKYRSSWKSIIMYTKCFAENKSSATTEGTISVTKPDAANPEDVVPVPPVDPNDPDTPFTPDEPNQGTSGLLTIDQAPDLDFGTIKLGTAKQYMLHYKAERTVLEHKHKYRISYK